MIPGSSVIILLHEAKKVFGEPKDWDTRVVTSWLITTAREIAAGPKGKQP